MDTVSHSGGRSQEQGVSRTAFPLKPEARREPFPPLPAAQVLATFAPPRLAGTSLPCLLLRGIFPLCSGLKCPPSSPNTRQIRAHSCQGIRLRPRDLRGTLALTAPSPEKVTFEGTGAWDLSVSVFGQGTGHVTWNTSVLRLIC